MIDKVTIEVTVNGFTVTAKEGRKVISRRTTTMESTGSARGTEPGDVTDDLPNQPKLADAIESLGLFEVASEMRRDLNVDE